MSTIQIQFITDFTCPYCYVARSMLLEAVKEEDVEIVWLPYEASPVSEPQIDTFHDPRRKQRYRKDLLPLCRSYHIEMNLPPRVVPRPYTRLAFKGYLYAEQQGRGQEYSQYVLDAYYKEEKNIGSADVLTSLAETAGLQPEAFSEALDSPDYEAALEQLEQTVLHSLQPTALPTILIGNSIRLDGGVYTVEQFRELLKKAASEEIISRSGSACGINGCSF